MLTNESQQPPASAQQHIISPQKRQMILPRQLRTTRASNWQLPIPAPSSEGCARRQGLLLCRLLYTNYMYTYSGTCLCLCLYLLGLVPAARRPDRVSHRFLRHLSANPVLSPSCTVATHPGWRSRLADTDGFANAGYPDTT